MKYTYKSTSMYMYTLCRTFDANFIYRTIYLVHTQWSELQRLATLRTS